MELITKFRADYKVLLSTGRVVTIPDIEREVWFDKDRGEEISFSAKECYKIEKGIEAICPGYFTDRKSKKKKI